MAELDAAINSVLRFKNVDQVGVVVHDIKDAVRNYRQKLGIRTWYRAVSAPDDDGSVFFRGQKLNSDIEFVLGYCGGLQFELVQSSGDANIYSEHLEKHGEGLHHVCFFVSDLERKLAAYKKLDIEPVQTGRVKGKGGAITHYAYLESGKINGLCIEMSETRLYGLPTKMSPFMMKVGKLTGDLEVVEY